MGIIDTEIELRNALDSRLQPHISRALVDTDTLLLCIPEHTATRLKPPTLPDQTARLPMALVK